MRVIIKTKNLDLAEGLKNFTEEKFFGLQKFINILKKEEEKKTLAEVLVELEKETEHHKKGKIFNVKAQIHLPDRDLMAQADSDDLMKAVIAAKEGLKIEIEKYKFKNIDKNRRQQRKAGL